MQRERIGVLSVPWVGVPPKGQGSISGKTHRLTEVLADQFDFTIVGGSTGRAPQNEHPAIAYVPIDASVDRRYLDRATGLAYRLAGRARHTYYRVPYHPYYARRAAAALARARCTTIIVHEFPQWLPLVAKANPGARLVLWGGADSFIESDTLLPHVRRADLLIGASRFLARRFAERVPEMADRIHVVHSGIDVDHFRPPDGPRAPERIVYAGRITPEKGIHVLVDAFRRMAESRPGLELVLVGPRWTSDPSLLAGTMPDHLPEVTRLAGTDYVAELIRRAGPYADRVSLPGSLRRDDLTRCLQEATVFCHPVLCPEGFGQVVAEAMACAAPVVTSELGGQPEYVLDGWTGRVSPAGDVDRLVCVLGELLDDPERRAALGRRARQLAEDRLSARACAAALADVLAGRATPTSLVPALP
jgi:glycosyltransferase involved in cell wall biosynthesis